MKFNVVGIGCSYLNVFSVRRRRSTSQIYTVKFRPSRVFNPHSSFSIGIRSCKESAIVEKDIGWQGKLFTANTCRIPRRNSLNISSIPASKNSIGSCAIVSPIDSSPVSRNAGSTTIHFKTVVGNQVRKGVDKNLSVQSIG